MLNANNYYKDCFVFSEACGASKPYRADGLFKASEIDNKIKVRSNLINEKSMIESRANKAMESNEKICAYHRYQLGVLWKSPKSCVHPLHQQPNIKNWRTAKSPKGLRPASMIAYEKINSSFPFQFPMFGNLCPGHRKEATHVVESDDENHGVESDDENQQNDPDYSMSSVDEFQSFVEQSPADISPLKFRIIAPIDQLAESTLRYQKRKYKEYIDACKKRYAEIVAPGQEDQFTELFLSYTDDTENSIPDDLKFLHKAFIEADSEKQKTLILSAIPKESYSISKIMNIFSCSQNRVQQARKWAESFGALNLKPEKQFTKNKLNVNSAEHFINFLFETDLIQDVAYGTNTLKFSDGSKQLLPKAILTLSRSHTIAEYKEHCQHFDFTPLSDSTLWQILKAIKPGQRHAMAGLDNTTSDGLKGFQLLIEQLNKFDIDSKTKSELKKDLEDCKRYLKLKYPLHCREECPISTHCLSFALCHPTDDNFQPEHDHGPHTEVCSDCFRLCRAMDQIKQHANEITTDDIKDEVVYDVNQGVNQVLTWMKHILRSVKQDEAKQYAMENLSSETAFWLSDWAQKILPSSFREGQREYFGKKGMSLHVDVFLKRTANNDLVKHTYLTSISRCDQDVLETLCVAEHVIKQFKKDFPHINSLYRKSDNASCYAGNSVSEIEYAICRASDIKLLRHDYNEPQKGKDQADRDSAVAKRYLNAYVHSGNDCLSAIDIKKGILHQGGPKNTKVSVVEIDKSKCEITHSKIKDIQSFHSVRFHRQGMIFWRYFDCGAGRYEPFHNLEFASGLSVVSEFSEIHDVSVFVPKKRGDRGLCNLFFCSHPGCIDSFHSDEELSTHVALNDHHFHSTEMSNIDSVKAHYAKLMHEASHTMTSQNQPSKSFPICDLVRNCSLYKEVSTLGWALPKRSNTKFNQAQRQFLYEEFKKGMNGGKKTTPEAVVLRMRTLRDEENKRVFAPNQWLTKEQVPSS